MGINDKLNGKGERLALEDGTDLIQGRILDRIRGTFPDVTVSFARCFIRITRPSVVTADTPIVDFRSAPK